MGIGASVSLKSLRSVVIPTHGVLPRGSHLLLEAVLTKHSHEFRRGYALNLRQAERFGSLVSDVSCHRTGYISPVYAVMLSDWTTVC